MSARLRARVAEALGIDPDHVYFSRYVVPAGGTTVRGTFAPAGTIFWTVGDGYRYKGGPYFVEGSPTGTGCTQAAAVLELEELVRRNSRGDV